MLPGILLVRIQQIPNRWKNIFASRFRRLRSRRAHFRLAELFVARAAQAPLAVGIFRDHALCAINFALLAIEVGHFYNSSLEPQSSRTQTRRTSSMPQFR